MHCEANLWTQGSSFTKEAKIDTNLVQVVNSTLNGRADVEVNDGRPALILDQFSTEVVVVNNARILGLHL